MHDHIYKKTYLGHSTVNNKVTSINKATLVTGQENNCMSLFNGLTETTGGEVHLTTETLGLVVAQPVLQERGAITISNRLTDQRH